MFEFDTIGIIGGISYDTFLKLKQKGGFSSEGMTLVCYVTESGEKRIVAHKANTTVLTLFTNHPTETGYHFSYSSFLCEGKTVKGYPPELNSEYHSILKDISNAINKHCSW